MLLAEGGADGRMSVRRDAPVSAPKQQGRLYAALDAGVCMRLSTASIGCYDTPTPTFDSNISTIAAEIRRMQADGCGEEGIYKQLLKLPAWRQLPLNLSRGSFGYDFSCHDFIHELLTTVYGAAIRKPPEIQILRLTFENYDSFCGDVDLRNQTGQQMLSVIDAFFWQKPSAATWFEQLLKWAKRERTNMQALDGTVIGNDRCTNDNRTRVNELILSGVFYTIAFESRLADTTMSEDQKNDVRLALFNWETHISDFQMSDIPCAGRILHWKFPKRMTCAVPDTNAMYSAIGEPSTKRQCHAT